MTDFTDDDLIIQTEHTESSLNIVQVAELYSANNWSASQKADVLMKAMLNSDALVTAWLGERLVGLGNAISDGHLVVYYPHLLVHPEYHNLKIGSKIFSVLKSRYMDFHQHILVSDANSVGFYKKMGFEQAGNTMSMWIYAGTDH